MKKLFKAVINLTKKDIKHGNITPYQVYFLSNGYTKLAGWYQENKKKFENDFVDACGVIYSCVTLQILEGQFSLKTL